MERGTAIIFLLAFALGGCATPGGAGTEAKEGPSKLKVPQEEVPAAVRAIESLIDRRGALIADEVEIHASRNYEWDVSLTGDDVRPQRPEADGQVSEAFGNPRAMFRNLDIRAYRRIVFKKSGFDVVPFIRVVARGHASYLVERGGAAPEVRRAHEIRIQNAEISFDGRSEEQPTIELEDPIRVDGGAAPVGVRDR